MINGYLLQMGFGIYILLVICIISKIMISQNTAMETKRKCEAQLSEMNDRMYALQRTMDSFVTDNQNQMDRFFTDNQKQIDELKCAYSETFDCETNKAVYTIHYSLAYWLAANKSCQSKGSDLVSFESVEEYNHVLKLILKKCSSKGFWTSAKKVGNKWMWKNKDKTVLDSLWNFGEPCGDGGCGYMSQDVPYYPLNDISCWSQMCYICESHGDTGGVKKPKFKM